MPEVNEEPKRRVNPEKQKKIKVQKAYLNIKIHAFYIVLMVIAIIGLLIPLRPTESALEKRELEKFPKFTLSTFWNGEFFNDISTWYADTFPGREKLMAANSDFKALYGVQGEQIVTNTDKTGDDIPEAGQMVIVEKESEEEKETISESINESVEETIIETEEETFVDGAITVVPEMAGNVYVSGDTAFSIFYFDLDGANKYINMIDNAQKKLDGLANVYDILVPTSIAVTLDEEAQEKIGSQDQEKAIEYIYSNIENLNGNVTTVDAFHNIKNHNSEYIYFRTDHHWTALGAYYAYEAFCKAKGIEANDIDSFEKVEYPNFVGSLYASSNQVAALKNNPDTVIAYIPKATNQMMFIDHKGATVHWSIVNDVSAYDSGSKYSTFAGADEPFSQIDNPNLSDGSSCVVIKESYGNAFVPFLVDHYQHVYIVDYRYFYKYPKYNNSLVQLVQENNIQDVIFINNAEAMVGYGRISEMNSLFQ